MGPFKHEVDDGLDLRKVNFYKVNTMDQLSAVYGAPQVPHLAFNSLVGYP